MPIYEYECKKCGHQTEAMQKFSDPPIAECEMCHGKMKKLISPSTFHLKGTGWYVTDYASKSRSDPGSESRSDPGSESSSKSEQGKGKTSKPDTKSPKKEAKDSTNSSGKKDSSDSKGTSKSKS